MKTAVVVLLAFLAAPAPLDVSGKWTGTIELTGAEGTRTNPAFAVLKQEKSAVTGSGGPSEAEQYPIRNGKIERGKLTLEADVAGAPASFQLTVERDRIFGEIRRPGGDYLGKLDLKRAGTTTGPAKGQTKKAAPKKAEPKKAS